MYYKINSKEYFWTFIFRTIYEKLGSAFSEEQQNFYQQKADEITPNIRYCAYNLDDENVDINELMKMRFSSGGGTRDLLADKLDVSYLSLYINGLSPKSIDDYLTYG